jgi:hypothetical protein
MLAELVCQSPSPRGFSASSKSSGRKNPRRSSGVMSLAKQFAKALGNLLMGERGVEIGHTTIMVLDQPSFCSQLTRLHDWGSAR